MGVYMDNSLDDYNLNHRAIWPELYDSEFPAKYEIVNITKETEHEGAVEPLSFKYNDGGRLDAGFKTKSRDCVARSISIAARLPYIDVYKDLANGNFNQRATKKVGKRKNTASEGIFTNRKWFKDYMKSLGFVFRSTLELGSRKRVKLRAGSIPNGRLIVKTRRHYVAVIDGVIHDTYDPSHNGEQVVYGYWIKANESPSP
jgi:hypothetical protein